jgi:hypothetical protein
MSQVQSSHRASLFLPLLGGLRRLMPVPAMMEPATPVPAHVAVGQSVRVLARALRPGLNLAIWLRDGQPGCDARRQAFDRFPHLDVALDETDVRVGRGVGASLLPRALPAEIRALLAADIDRLSSCLQRMTGASTVRVKLRTCDGDECRIFHVDHIAVRLITTCIGPGTDWLEDSAARREHLGGRGLPRPSTIDAMNQAIVTDWTRVHRLPRFAVAAFRGHPGHTHHTHSADTTSAIIHRSPPIAGTGITRLRLVVEPSGQACGCSA